MFKGYTKIELTDIKTNEVQVFEEHNMPTDALVELCSPKPYFGNFPLDQVIKPNNQREENLKEIVGAVALTASSLSEIASNTIIPAGTGITAVGPNFVNSQRDGEEYGSFNDDPELSFYDTENNICQFTWDFDTSQGNGIIKTACLMPGIGARQITGISSFNPSIATDVVTLKDTIFYYKKPLPWKSINNLNKDYPLFLDIDKGFYLLLKNYDQQFATTNTVSRNSIVIKKSLEIDIVKIPGANSISLFDSCLVNNNKSESKFNCNNIYPSTKKIIQMPDELKNALSYYDTYIEDMSNPKTYYYYMECFQTENSIILAIKPPAIQDTITLSNGNRLFIWTINISELLNSDNYKGSFSNFFNYTGEDIYFGSNKSYYGLIAKNIHINKNKIIVHGYSSNSIKIINLLNNIDVQTVQMKNGNTYYTSEHLFYCGYDFDNHFRYGNYYSYYPTASAAQGRVQEIDLVSNIHYDKNQCQFLGGSGSDGYIEDYGNIEARYWGSDYILGIQKVPGYSNFFAAVVASSLSNSGGAYVGFYPSDIIFTINNFSSTIEKTNNQIMRITYIISEGQ